MKKLVGRLNRRQVQMLEDVGERVLFGLQITAVALFVGIVLELLWQPGR